MTKKKKPKKERSWRPVADNYHDLNGRQGWFLKEATSTYEDWKFFKDGVCMETRRFYKPKQS